MNKLTTDLKMLHEATLDNLKSSKANNTLRAYRSDFKDFGAFCAKHGLNSLPSEPKIISLYLTHLSAFSKFSNFSRRFRLFFDTRARFEALIYNRSKKKSDCPYCTGRLATKENNLQTF